MPAADGVSPEDLRRAIRAAHPRFFAAVLADARVTAGYRAERFEFRSRADAAVQALRLMWVSDHVRRAGALSGEGPVAGVGRPDPPAAGAPARDGDRAGLDRRSGDGAAGRLPRARSGRDRRDRDDRVRGRDLPLGHDRVALGELPGPDDRAERAHRFGGEDHRAGTCGRGRPRRRECRRGRRRGAGDDRHGRTRARCRAGRRVRARADPGTAPDRPRSAPRYIPTDADPPEGS